MRHGQLLTEDLEDVVGERGWTAKGEELLIDSREFFLVQHTRRDVVKEAFVPAGRKYERNS